MRIISLGFLLCVTSLVAGQEERRYGLRYNEDLYKQATPRQTLGSLLRALEKERYPYIVAFLLEPDYVKEQLQITAPYYETLMREKVMGENLETKGFDKAAIRQRIRDLTMQTNFEHLADRVKAKLAEDPESIKELRKMFREGLVAEQGDTATIKHPDVKGRALFFRKVGDRWYIENKMQE